MLEFPKIVGRSEVPDLNVYLILDTRSEILGRLNQQNIISRDRPHIMEYEAPSENDFVEMFSLNRSN